MAGSFITSFIGSRGNGNGNNRRFIGFLPFSSSRSQNNEADTKRLFDAIRNGNMNDVSLVLNLEGFDPNVTNSHGFTPLHLACRYGRVDVVQYLVEEDGRVNVELKSRNGFTALHWACWKNSLASVKSLVEKGNASVKSQTRGGDSLLHLASLYGSFDLVRYLVAEQESDVEALNHRGETALDHAFRSEKLDVVRCLLPRMACINETSFRWAWIYSYPWDVRRMVLQKFAAKLGQADAFQRNPIQTIFLEFKLPSPGAYHYSVKNFPSSFTSLFDDQGRLAVHIALTSRKKAIKSPTMVELLLDVEPRAAITRDPLTGFYPHEMAATLACDGDDDEYRWLGIVYGTLRRDPEWLLSCSRGKAMIGGSNSHHRG